MFVPGLAMPLIAPVWGLLSPPWGLTFLRVAQMADIDFEHLADDPLLPAPEACEEISWQQRAVTTTEAGKWLRSLLSRQLGEIDFTTIHSLKATPLSWCAKAGLSPHTRLLLGHHTTDKQSADTYARDAIPVVEEALVLIQDIGDFHAEYLAYGLLCQALLDVDNMSQAEGRAREAVERMKAKGPRPHALALNLLAGVLSETSPAHARAAGQEALRLSQRLGDQDLEAQIWLRLSSIEAVLERDDETLQALEKAMALWKQLPERSEAIACARYLSISVLLRMFDPKDSLKEASQVRAFFSEEKVGGFGESGHWSGLRETFTDLQRKGAHTCFSHLTHKCLSVPFGME
eukprot:s1755_g2.t1